MKLVTLPAPPRTVLVLPFAAPPLTTNEARSGSNHWGPKAAAKAAIERAVIALVRHHRVPHYRRCAITLESHTATFQQVDCDSLYFMLKAVVDSLTPPRAATPCKPGKKRGGYAKNGAGIIDGDHAAIVVAMTCAIVLADPPARILLIIDPA